jgi:hypothetical protein
VCNSGFDSRSQCQLQGCPGDGLCSGRGSCQNGQCVCQPGAHGTDCGLDVCGNTSALRAGLYAEYFNTYTGDPFQTQRNFRTIVFRAVVPDIANTWGNGAPGPRMQDDGTYITWAGAIRPFHSGATMLRCRFSGSACRVFADGVLVNETVAVSMVTGLPIRIKVEFEVRESSFDSLPDG